MSRNTQWRHALGDLVSWRQDEGLNATIFIVREIGPTGFLLKEDGVTKPVKVCEHLAVVLLLMLLHSKTSKISNENFSS